MPVEINIRPALRKKTARIISSRALKRLCLDLLEDLSEAESELSLLVTGRKEIHKLNLEYRGKDKSTDVLSFPLREGSAGAYSGTELGDVVISLDNCLEQAKDFGVKPREEFIRLLIHGTLHLLGYDHEGVSKKEAQRMRRKERSLLKKFVQAA